MKLREHIAKEIYIYIYIYITKNKKLELATQQEVTKIIREDVK
jgi:hypothetical protein